MYVCRPQSPKWFSKNFFLTALPSSPFFSRYTKWIHGLCWGVPLAETFAAVVLNAVDGDNVSGLCLVGAVNHVNLVALLLAPLAVKLGVGIVLLGFGLVGVSKVWEMLDADQVRREGGP